MSKLRIQTTRYFLASTEYKWSHAHKHMEHMWVRRELGEELWAQCNQPGFELVYIRSRSQTLPEDVYCRCDVYVDVADSRQSTLFALQGHTPVNQA